MFDQDFSLDQDLDVGGGREVSGEVGLALAIIGQAFRDATGNTITRWKTENERVDIAAEARAFLLAESGDWCRSREDIAAIADVDPEWIRTKFEEIFRRACELDPAYAERCEEDDFAWAARKRQKSERERLAAERKAETAARREERERLAAERKVERERIAAEREAKRELREQEQRRHKQAQYQRQHRERAKDPNYQPREPMSDEARAARRKETVRRYNAARLAKLKADLQSPDPEVRARAEERRDKMRESQARSYRRKVERERQRVESAVARRLLSSTCLTSWRLAA